MKGPFYFKEGEIHFMKKNVNFSLCGSRYNQPELGLGTMIEPLYSWGKISLKIAKFKGVPVSLRNCQMMDHCLRT